jgi:hypothetical protein
LDDEHPLPPRVSKLAVELEDASGDETGAGTLAGFDAVAETDLQRISKNVAGVHDGDSRGDLGAGVKVRDDEESTGVADRIRGGSQRGAPPDLQRCFNGAEDESGGLQVSARSER